MIPASLAFFAALSASSPDSLPSPDSLRAARDSTAADSAGPVARDTLAMDSTPIVVREAPVIRTYKRVRAPSTLLLPIPSLLLPGLGQLIQGRLAPGFAYAGASLAGIEWYSLATPDSMKDLSLEDAFFNRNRARERLYGAGVLYQGAGLLSAWDVFQASVPTLQHEKNRFKFMGTKPRERFVDLLVAPYLPGNLARPTTWVPLAAFGGLTYFFIAQYRRETNADHPGARWWSYDANDAFFTHTLSLNAGATEEAFFRGYAYPLFYQWSGQRDWVANPAQALLFGLAHYGTVDFPVVQTLLGSYLAWLTRRNGWTVGQSVCIHFWWDIIALSGALLTRHDVPVSLGRVELPFDF